MIRLSKERSVYSLSADAPPAARVSLGETLELETADCFAGQIAAPGLAPAAIDWERINPATGPVFVEGVGRGDVLTVLVERVDVADRGVMAVSPEFGVTRDRFRETSFEVIVIEQGIAALPGGARAPIEPMIGVIGVAPSGAPVACGSPGAHGGNMDTRLIGEGATVYLPVSSPGALLAAGDLHALMGDGEICGTGVEVAGRVTLRVDVRRGLELTNPVVDTAEVVATIASAETLDEAADRATRDMAELLSLRLGLPAAHASMLMSAAGRLRVSQVVDPLKTARFEMPKTVLSTLGDDLI